MNLLLGAFNLIPAFPMDGGRVFRALLAERMKFSDATKYAAYIGRIFGILMVVVGFFFDPLLIVVGIFIYIGASEEAEQTIVSTTLASVRVKDVMQSEVGSVRPDQTLAEALKSCLKTDTMTPLLRETAFFKGSLFGMKLSKFAPTSVAT